MDPITIAISLAQFAPSLIKYLGGSDKTVDVAEKAIDIAKTLTGKTTASDALDIIKADPSMALQYQLEVLRQEKDIEALYIEDKKDARDRDKEIIKAGRYNYRSDILALLAVCGLIACMYFIAKDSSIEERAVNAIMFVAGVLASAVRDVYSFEFGSSRGSKEANNALQDIYRSKG